MFNKELEEIFSSVLGDGEVAVANEGVSSSKFLPGQAVTYLVGEDENGALYIYEV